MGSPKGKIYFEENRRKQFPTNDHIISDSFEKMNKIITTNK